MLWDTGVAGAAQSHTGNAGLTRVRADRRMDGDSSCLLPSSGIISHPRGPGWWGRTAATQPRAIGEGGGAQGTPRVSLPGPGGTCPAGACARPPVPPSCARRPCPARSCTAGATLSPLPQPNTPHHPAPRPCSVATPVQRCKGPREAVIGGRILPLQPSGDICGRDLLLLWPLASLMLSRLRPPNHPDQGSGAVLCPLSRGSTGAGVRVAPGTCPWPPAVCRAPVPAPMGTSCTIRTSRTAGIAEHPLCSHPLPPCPRPIQAEDNPWWMTPWPQCVGTPQPRQSLTSPPAAAAGTPQTLRGTCHWAEWPPWCPWGVPWAPPRPPAGSSGLP